MIPSSNASCCAIKLKLRKEKVTKSTSRSAARSNTECRRPRDWVSAWTVSSCSSPEHPRSATSSRSRSCDRSRCNVPIIVLGAGRVAAPAIEVLMRSFDVVLVDADASALAYHRAMVGHRLTVVERDVTREPIYDILQNAEVVLSLLPAPLHVLPARACIAARIPLVTTSYVSDDMRALDAEARAAGVSLLNECGLDPGIDHMLAMRSIDDVHDRGGAVRIFESFCGGLPARRG